MTISEGGIAPRGGYDWAMDDAAPEATMMRAVAGDDGGMAARAKGGGAPVMAREQTIYATVSAVFESCQ